MVFDIIFQDNTNPEADKALADIAIPATAPGESTIIRYTGRPGDYEALSFIDVLNGTIPKEALRGILILFALIAQFLPFFAMLIIGLAFIVGEIPLKGKSVPLMVYELKEVIRD